jgi:hypothetical protein
MGTNKFDSLEEICDNFLYLYHDCLEYSNNLYNNILKMFNTEDIEDEIFNDSYIDNFETEYEKNKWVYWKANYFLKVKNDTEKYISIMNEGIKKYNDPEMMHDIASCIYEKDRDTEKYKATVKQLWREYKYIYSIYSIAQFSETLFKNDEDYNFFVNEFVNHESCCKTIYNYEKSQGDKIKFNDFFNENGNWCPKCIVYILKSYLSDSYSSHRGINIIEQDDVVTQNNENIISQNNEDIISQNNEDINLNQIKLDEGKEDIEGEEVQVQDPYLKNEEFAEEIFMYSMKHFDKFSREPKINHNEGEPFDINYLFSDFIIYYLEKFKKCDDKDKIEQVCEYLKDKDFEQYDYFLSFKYVDNKNESNKLMASSLINTNFKDKTIFIESIIYFIENEADNELNYITEYLKKQIEDEYCEETICMLFFITLYQIKKKYYKRVHEIIDNISYLTFRGFISGDSNTFPIQYWNENKEFDFIKKIEHYFVPRSQIKKYDINKKEKIYNLKDDFTKINIDNLFKRYLSMQMSVKSVHNRKQILNCYNEYLLDILLEDHENHENYESYITKDHNIKIFCLDLIKINSANIKYAKSYLKKINNNKYDHINNSTCSSSLLFNINIGNITKENKKCKEFDKKLYLDLYGELLNINDEIFYTRYRSDEYYSRTLCNYYLIEHIKKNNEEYSKYINYIHAKDDENEEEEKGDTFNEDKMTIGLFVKEIYSEKILKFIEENKEIIFNDIIDEKLKIIIKYYADNFETHLNTDDKQQAKIIFIDDKEVDLSNKDDPEFLEDNGNFVNLCNKYFIGEIENSEEKIRLCFIYIADRIYDIMKGICSIFSLTGLKIIDIYKKLIFIKNEIANGNKEIAKINIKIFNGIIDKIIAKDIDDKYTKILDLCITKMEECNKIKKYNLLFIDNVDNCECNICYESDFDKIIKLECGNTICEKCYFNVSECPFKCGEDLS